MGKTIDNIVKGICLFFVIIGCIWFIGVLGLMGVFGDYDADNSQPTATPLPTIKVEAYVEYIKNSASSISYDELMRNNNDHIGEVVYKRGEILQVSERRSDKYVLRVATQPSTYGYYEDIVWVEYEGDRLLEGDIIDVWGKSKGLETYDALLGNQVTIPKIDSIHVELVTKAGNNR